MHTRHVPVVLLVVCTVLLLALGGAVYLVMSPRTSALSTNTREDDFNRVNTSAGWGTSTNTDGDPTFAWGGSAASSTNVVITSNTGQMTYPGATGTVLSGFAGSNTFNGGDQLVKFSFAAVGQAFASSVLNATSDENNWYQVQADSSSNTFKLLKKSGGSTTTEASAAWTPTVNTFYWMRLDFVASTGALNARVWPDGTTEPSTWTVSWTDTGTKLAAGLPGVATRWLSAPSGSAAVTYDQYAYASSGTAVPPDQSPPTPTPTATATATPTPPPTGRYSGDWPHNSMFVSNGDCANPATIDSQANAISIVMTWATVEPTKGNYSFSCYDTELSQAAAQGKRVFFIFWDQQVGNGCATSGQSTPQYVWNDIGSSNYFCDTANNTLIANYWNSTYIADWQAYMQGVASHYAGNANVADIVYVRGNLGKGGETEFCKTGLKDGACTTQLEAWSPNGATNKPKGFLGDWRDWLEARAANQAAYFTYAYVVTSVDDWDNNGTTQYTDSACTYPDSPDCTYHGEYVYWGATQSPDAYIAGSNALPGNAGDVQGIYSSIATHHAGHHFEFQEGSAAGSSGASDTEAKTAWCYSESDPRVSPGTDDVTDVEWYKGVFGNGWAGPNEFPGWQDQTSYPGADSSVCSGL